MSLSLLAQEGRPSSGDAAASAPHINLSGDLRAACLRKLLCFPSLIGSSGETTERGRSYSISQKPLSFMQEIRRFICASLSSRSQVQSNSKSASRLCLQIIPAVTRFSVGLSARHSHIDSATSSHEVPDIKYLNRPFKVRTPCYWTLKLSSTK